MGGRLDTGKRARLENGWSPEGRKKSGDPSISFESGWKISNPPVGEGNEFVICSLNNDAEGPLPGSLCLHSSILCILSKGCVLKEHVQEVLFEVSEKMNNSFLDLAPKCASWRQGVCLLSLS